MKLHGIVYVGLLWCARAAAQPCPNGVDVEGLASILEQHGYRPLNQPAAPRNFWTGGRAAGVVLQADHRFVVCERAGARFVMVAREYLIDHHSLNQPRTFGLFNSHHIIQNKWAKEQLGRLYSETQAPTILLVDKGSAGPRAGSPHQNTITDQQQNAAGRKQRTYEQERELGERYLQLAGVPAPEIHAALAEADSYFCGIAHANPGDANVEQVFAGSACLPQNNTGSASAVSVTVTQNVTLNGKPGVRFDVAGIQVAHMVGKKVHIGFNVKHINNWIQWVPFDVGQVTSDPQTIADRSFHYPYDLLRAPGALDQPFYGWFYVVASDTKVDLLEKGPTEFRVDPPPAAAPPPAQPAVYSYTNPAGTVSVQLTDGTADNWGTLTGHGTLTFLGARFDCQLIVERHEVYNSDPKTYDYATNVKPGPECARPYRFVGVDGVADFTAQGFYSYPNGYGLLYLTQAIVSVNINGTRAQAANPVDIQLGIDAVVPHVSFNLGGNDVQFGRFHFAPGGFSFWKDGFELKQDSGSVTIDEQEAKGLLSIRWVRQADGYHLQYGFGSEWTAKLPQYGVH